MQVDLSDIQRRYEQMADEEFALLKRTDLRPEVQALYDRELVKRRSFRVEVALTELEERIIAFVVEETGMNEERISLSSSLNDDIGMDGDDASEFFEKFRDNFNVDIALLEHHWNEHFGPEVGAPSFGCFVVIGAAVILGDLLHLVFQPMPSWASVIVLIIAFSWVHNRFFADHDESVVRRVTLSDLVDAAKAGKWVKHYDNDGTSMFHTL